MAVLMPMRLPSKSTKAPPLLPGLTAASVWRKLSTGWMSWDALDSKRRMLRPLALTIPAVTVEVKLSGLPTANTHSPTRTSSEFPKAMAAKGAEGSIFRTPAGAGIAPTTSAG